MKGPFICEKKTPYCYIVCDQGTHKNGMNTMVLDIKLATLKTNSELLSKNWILRSLKDPPTRDH